MKKLSFILIFTAALTLGVSAQTFVGGSSNEDLGDAQNWSGSTLPTNSGSPGTLGINATVDGSTTYDGLYITQSAGDITQDSQGGGDYTLSNGGFTMNGGTWTTRRGMRVHNQAFVISGGALSIAPPGGGGDGGLNIDLGGSMTINSGSITVQSNEEFFLDDNSALTINGGTVTVDENFGIGRLAGGSNTINLFGGTTNVGRLQFGDNGAGLTVNFGGSTAGSFIGELYTPNGTDSENESARDVNWLSGSLMTMQLTLDLNNSALDNWAQREYDAGRLTYNGDDKTALGFDWDEVISGPNQIWNFDTGTSTLSLIPEPSSFALMGLGFGALYLLRRRQS